MNNIIIIINNYKYFQKQSFIPRGQTAATAGLHKQKSSFPTILSSHTIVTES